MWSGRPPAWACTGGSQPSSQPPNERPNLLGENRIVSRYGPQPIQLSLGGRYYADRPQGGPDWGIRFTLTFLFPK